MPARTRLARPTGKPKFTGYPNIHAGDQNRHVLALEQSMADYLESQDVVFEPNNLFTQDDFDLFRSIIPGNPNAINGAHQSQMFDLAYPDLANTDPHGNPKAAQIGKK